MRLIDKILPLVRKPSRYINSEWNSVHKTPADVTICFCFPDLSELGSSNLGIEILYQIVNKRSDALAERCFSPDIDLENELRKRNMPLFSLESQSPLKMFDILGFSLQYELCFTNVLTMLDLAGIPVHRADRGNHPYPLIIAGGPVCFNPEPMSEFFDLFVIGDGEDVVGEIIDIVKKFKVQSSEFGAKNKEEQILKTGLLEELAKIAGVYVPSVHKKEGLKIDKRSVDINSSFFPVAPVVPYIQTVHDRLNVEISRGCAYRCKFCNATNVYNPWRERSPEVVMEYVKQGLKNTGHNRVTLSSFCINGYTGIEKLMKSVSGYCLPRNVSLSVPSLKCTANSLELLPYLMYPQRTNLTFAIEAGSERLRSSIGKNITDQDIFNILSIVHRYGWKTVKLYFMIGLPSETDEDIESIINLVNRLKKFIPGLRYNVTISFFVPKSHTPLQWHGMESYDSLARKKQILLRRLRAEVRSHNLEMSVLEAVFSRGDSRLSAVILKAFEKGARFDHWADNFKSNVWEEAFKEANIEKEPYLSSKNFEEPLPWEYINTGRKKESLYNEYRSVFENNRDIVGSTSDFKESVIPGVSVGPYEYKTPKNRYIYRLRFGRKGSLRYISHLEQVELLRKCIVRTELPVNYTSGFHPQLKMAFGPAISVGYESECEFADIEFNQRVDQKVIAEKITAKLPQNFILLEVRTLPVQLPSIDSLANVAEYYIEGVEDTDIEGKLKKVSESSEVFAQVKKKDEVKTINIRPLLYSIKPSGEGISLYLRFGPARNAAGGAQNIKPDIAIGAIFKLKEEESKLLAIIRKMLYHEKSDGSISPV